MDLIIPPSNLLSTSFATILTSAVALLGIDPVAYSSKLRTQLGFGVAMINDLICILCSLI